MGYTKFIFKLSYNSASHLGYFLQIAHLLDCDTKILSTAPYGTVAYPDAYHSNIEISGEKSNIAKLQQIYDEIAKLYGAKINA